MKKLHKLRELLRFERQLRLERGAVDHPVAGIDEVGRGPLAGPLVACALILRDTRFLIPIDDSKKLTPKARELACRAILPKAHVGLGAVWPEEIDRVGIHKACGLAMLRAFQRLPVKPVLVLVDGPWKFPGIPVPQVPIVDGDAKSLSIACASIVAKVTRDRWMERLHRLIPEYGFTQHKGYGTPAHKRALLEIGPSDFHRYSFAPVRTGGHEVPLED